MKVKDVIKNCKEYELIIVRKNGFELKTTNIKPYIKGLYPYWEKEVKDYFKDGENCTIILMQ